MVGLRTRLAIERARTVTPHLKRCAPVLYPNGTILLIFACSAASAARRRSAAFRHLVWAVGILGTLTLPLVTLLLPAWHSATLGNDSGVQPTP
jgi:hypothetical protein